MPNHLRLEGYVSELIGKPKVELDNRDKKFIVEILQSPKSVYGLTKIVNQDTTTISNSVAVFSTGPLSSPAVLKRIRKLVRYGLIEDIENEKLSENATEKAKARAQRAKEKARLANLHRAKLYKITEYGLFCVLSEFLEYEFATVFLRYWKTKVMRLFLSSYFEKKTVLRPTTSMYFALAPFLMEACSIMARRLSEIEEARRERDDTKYQEEMRRLEDDLLWHAKSFALRILADSACSDKERRMRSRIILAQLAHDKKFCKLRDLAIREILSQYRGNTLPEPERARH